MSEWKECIIGDLGKIITGKTPRTAITENYGGNVPFLSPSDNMEVKYVDPTSKTLTEKGVKEVKNCLLPKNAVCVSCIESDLGKVLITTQPTVTNQQINSIIVNEDNDTDFIYYLMTIVGNHLNHISKTSTAVPIINKTTFSNYKISVPPLFEQKKIAAVLSSLDNKIETNRKINARLEELAQAIFKSWFIDFEPFGGKMPEDWNTFDFDNVVEVIAGGTPKTEIKEYWDGDIPWISVKDFVNEPHFVMSTERYISTEGLSHSSTHLLEPNDIIISARGTVGAIAQIKEPMAFNQSCFGLRSKLKNGSHWLYFLMRNKVSELKQKSHGSVFDTINRKTLSDLQKTVPTTGILTIFHCVISTIIQKSLSLSIESARLADLRDTLLPKLMSGELIPE